MSREPLTLCVSSLTSSNDILASSVATLDSGVNDFPRMGRVLDTTRVSGLPLSSLGLATIFSSLHPSPAYVLAGFSSIPPSPTFLLLSETFLFSFASQALTPFENPALRHHTVLPTPVCPEYGRGDLNP